MRSFFETPSDVADELVRLAAAAHGGSRVRVLDACAGTGSLALAALRSPDLVSRLSAVDLVEVDPRLLDLAKLRLQSPLTKSYHLADIFEHSGAFEAADLVLCNPPFKSSSRWTEEQRAAAKSLKIAHYNDLACYCVIRLLEACKRATTFGFILREDLVTSKGYTRFWQEIAQRATVLDVVSLGRRLRPGSGAAQAAIVIMRASPSGATHPLLNPQGGSAGVRLGDLATVKAGPSVTKAVVSDPSGEYRRHVINIPRGHDGSELWGQHFQFSMKWQPRFFSAPRNLSVQGEPGFVYRLAGSAFRTAILPAGVNFLSSTPAVQPRSSEHLDFLTGCALLPSWRKYVRRVVRSTNFTPSAVADVKVPFDRNHLKAQIECLGVEARHVVSRYMSKRKKDGSLQLSVDLTALASNIDKNIADWVIEIEAGA